jgi:hypothetical protein
MTSKTTEKKRSRALQEQTGWGYQECLRCVRTMTEDQIDELIEQRAREALARKQPCPPSE